VCELITQLLFSIMYYKFKLYIIFLFFYVTIFNLKKFECVF